MTYTLTIWGPVATINGMSTGPVDSIAGLSADDVLAAFEHELSVGHTGIIADEDGSFVDPRDLGYLAEYAGQPC